MASSKVTINTERCKGCELCASVCPKQILAIGTHGVNAKGYHPIEVTDMDACIACASCAMMCPDGAISIMKEEV